MIAIGVLLVGEALDFFGRNVERDSGTEDMVIYVAYQKLNKIHFYVTVLSRRSCIDLTTSFTWF